MWHAVSLPIGWNGLEGGPGGGAFPFWLSLVMLLCAAGYSGVVLLEVNSKDLLLICLWLSQFSSFQLA